MRLRRWITLLLFSLLGLMGYGQGNTAIYPVEITTFITPPYGTCLKDMVGSQRFQVHVLLRDMTKKNDDFVIVMKVTNMSGTTVFRSQVGKFSFAQGGTMIVPAEVNTHILHNLFTPSNIEVGAQYATDCFPEGAYNISFQAFDATFYQMSNRRIPVSRESVVSLFMQGAASSAYLVYPYPNDSICSTTCGGVINYQWQPANPTGEAISYDLEVVELGDKDTKLSAGAAFQQIPRVLKVTNLYQSIYPHNILQGNNMVYKEGYYYAWRVTVRRGYEQKNLKGEAISSQRELKNEYREFQYRCTPYEAPVDTYDPKILAEKTIRKDLDCVTADTVTYTGVDALMKWKEDPAEIRGKYCGVGVEIRKSGGELWTAFKTDDTETFEKSLTNLSKGVTYEVRAHYIKCPDGSQTDTVYGPYCDTLEFNIPNVNEDSECGNPIPKLADCTDRKGKVLQPGDTIKANGTSIVVDKITSYSSDSTEISGEGHISFPILVNIQLAMRFSNVKINCEGQLEKGRISSVYDPKTCAVLDIEELTGEQSSGGQDKKSEDASVKKMDDFKSGSTGDFFEKDDGTIVMKGENGEEVEIGKKITLTNKEFTSVDHLSDKVHFVTFRNTDPSNAFDNDEHHYYESIKGVHYEAYDLNKKYIIPYLANSPGLLRNVEAVETSIYANTPTFKDVKFIIDMDDNESYISLKSEPMDGASGQWKVFVPGSSNSGSNLDVRVIANTEGSEKYEVVGKLIVDNYNRRTQNLVFVPTESKYSADVDKIQSYLNQVYGRLGIKYNVSEDRTFVDDENVRALLENGLDVTTDDEKKRRWDVETEDMRTIRRLYEESHPEMDMKNTAYIFLVNQGEGEFEDVEGDMPRNQSVGYIFMGDKSKLDNGRLVAHELGHGVYRLQHTFAYSGQESKKGTTDNLMDYSSVNPDFLAQFQWKVIADSAMFVWKALQDDEDGYLFGEGDLGICITPKGTPFVFKSSVFLMPRKQDVTQGVGAIYGFKSLNEQGQTEVFRYDIETDSYIGKTSKMVLKIEKKDVSKFANDEIIWLVDYINNCDVKVYSAPWSYVSNNLNRINFSDTKNLKFRNAYTSDKCSDSEFKKNANFKNPDNINQEYLSFFMKRAQKSTTELSENETYLNLFVELVNEQKKSKYKSDDDFGKVLSDKLSVYENNKYNTDNRKFIVVKHVINTLSVSQTQWDEFASAVFDKAGLTENDVLVCLPYVQCTGIGLDLGEYFFMPGIRMGRNLKIDVNSMRKDYSNIQRVASVKAAEDGGLETYDDLNVFQYVYDLFKYTDKPHVKRVGFLNMDGNIILEEQVATESNYVSTYDFRFEYDQRLNSLLEAYKQYWIANIGASSNGHYNYYAAEEALQRLEESCLEINATEPKYVPVNHGMNELVGTSKIDNCTDFMKWYRSYEYSMLNDELGIRDDSHDSPADNCFYLEKNQVEYDDNLEWIDAVGIVLAPLELDWTADVFGCIYSGYYADYLNATIYLASATLPYVSSKPLRKMVKYEGEFKDALNGVKKGSHTIVEITEETTGKKILQITEKTGSSDIGSKYLKYIEGGMSEKEAMYKLSEDLFGNQKGLENIVLKYSSVKDELSESWNLLAQKVGKGKANVFFREVSINVALYYLAYELTKEEGEKFNYIDCISDAVAEGLKQALEESSKHKNLTACLTSTDVQELSKLQNYLAADFGASYDQEYPPESVGTQVATGLDLLTDCVMGIIIDKYGDKLRSLLKKGVSERIFQNLRKKTITRRNQLMRIWFNDNIVELAKLPNGSRKTTWRNTLTKIVNEEDGLRNMETLVSSNFKISTLTAEGLGAYNDIMKGLSTESEKEKFLTLFSGTNNMNEILWYIKKNSDNAKDLIEKLNEVYSNVGKYAGTITINHKGTKVPLQQFLKKLNLPSDLGQKFYHFNGTLITACDAQLEYNERNKILDCCHGFAIALPRYAQNESSMILTNVVNCKNVFVIFQENIDKVINDVERENLQEFLEKIEEPNINIVETIIKFKGKLTHFTLIQKSEAELYNEIDE